MKAKLVFVVEEVYDFEGGEIKGIYTSFQAAKKFQGTLNESGDGNACVTPHALDNPQWKIKSDKAKQQRRYKKERAEEKERQRLEDLKPNPTEAELIAGEIIEGE